MWSCVPRDSDLRITALARASSNCYIRTITASVQLEKGKGIFREPRGRGTSVVGNRYQETASEDSEDLMCAVVTVISGVCMREQRGGLDFLD
jgi:hypothetical protein